MSQRLTQYERLFQKKKINSAMLLSMDDNDLWSSVSMKRGHRRKLLKSLKKYLVGPKMPKLPTPAPTPVPSEPSTYRAPEDDDDYQNDIDGEGGSKANSDEDSSGGSSGNSDGNSDDPSDLDDMSESEDEHVVDMEGT